MKGQGPPCGPTGLCQPLSSEQSNNIQIRARPGKRPREALGRDGLSCGPLGYSLEESHVPLLHWQLEGKSERLSSRHLCVLFQGFPHGPCDVTSFRTSVRERESLREVSKAAESPSAVILENDLWLTRARMGRRDRKFRMNRSTLLYLQWTTNKEQLYSTGKSAKCFVSA